MRCKTNENTDGEHTKRLVGISDEICAEPGEEGGAQLCLDLGRKGVVSAQV